MPARNPAKWKSANRYGADDGALRHSQRQEAHARHGIQRRFYNGTARNGQSPPPGTTPPGSLIMPLLTAMGSGYSATLKIGLQG